MPDDPLQFLGIHLMTLTRTNAGIWIGSLVPNVVVPVAWLCIVSPHGHSYMYPITTQTLGEFPPTYTTQYNQPSIVTLSIHNSTNGYYFLQTPEDHYEVSIQSTRDSWESHTVELCTLVDMVRTLYSDVCMASTIP